MRHVIVGECPSMTAYSSERGASGRPLSPFDGPGGQKIARLVGISLEDFLDTFERHNLFDHPVDKWDRVEARDSAIALSTTIKKSSPNERVMIVMMGRKVENAFVRGGMLRYFEVLRGQGPLDYVIVPHTSGLSHWWNDLKNVEKAAAWWRAAYESTRGLGPCQ